MQVLCSQVFLKIRCISFTHYFRYNKLIELVDQMFPPLGSFKSIDSSQSDYTAFSYWRTPMAEIPSLKDPESEDFEFP